MGKNIKQFDTNSEYEAYIDVDNKPNIPLVSWVDNTEKVHYDNWNRVPLTIEIISGGTLYWKATNASAVKTIKYKKNDGDYTTITSTTGGLAITAAAGDIFEFFGDNSSYAVFTALDAYNKSSFSGNTAIRFYLYGNVMSLINSTDFADLKDFTAEGVFAGLFAYQKVYSHPYKQLVLPATGLTTNCYRTMFSVCSEMTKAPILPATKVANRCYAYMFQYTKIDKLPSCGIKLVESGYYDDMFDHYETPHGKEQLPATDLEEMCYCNMFQGCTQLTEIPKDYIQATTLANRCCHCMFASCTNITSVPDLHAEIMSTSGYCSMFSGCTSLTGVPSNLLPATTLANSCYGGMFQGCTHLKNAPELPATILTVSCYQDMFRDCWQLEATPSELPALYLNQNCYYRMFYDCSGMTTAVEELPFTTFSAKTACCYGMFRGCASLTKAPKLLVSNFDTYQCCAYMFEKTGITDLPDMEFYNCQGNSCFHGAFMDCTHLTGTVELSPVMVATDSFYLMFAGCTSLTDVVLTPEQLGFGYRCYYGMFSACTSLTSITTNFIHEPEEPYTTNWVEGVAANGVFTKNSEAIWDEEGPSAIPVGWTVNNEYGLCLSYDMYDTESAATTFSVTVESNSSWTIVSKPSWLTTSVNAGGTGSTVVQVNISENDGSDYREDNIVFKTDTGNTTQKLVVIQADDTDYSQQPFTMEILSGGTLYFKQTQTGGRAISVHKNGTSIGTITPTIEGVPLECAAGDILTFYSETKGNAMQYNRFSGTDNLKVCIYGNMNSLSFGTGYTTTATTAIINYKWRQLFYGFSNLYTKGARRLIIPVGRGSGNQQQYLEYTFAYTNIENGHNLVFSGTSLWGNYNSRYLCYNCKNLKILPNYNTIASVGAYCLSLAFAYCGKLKNIDDWVMPQQVTTSPQQFNYTFYRCHNLRTAKLTWLPTTTTYQGNQYMFSEDMLLKQGPETLPVTSLSAQCYSYMFKGCTSLTKAPALPATALTPYCYQFMFSGCTDLEESPVLPAPTLANYCYQYLFDGCIKLNKITVLATNISASNSHNNWVRGVQTVSGTFIRPSGVVWPNNASGVPTNWTQVDAT